MAYSKTVWVNDTTPDIDAANLNKMEQGIYDVTDSSEAESKFFHTVTKEVAESKTFLDCEFIKGNMDITVGGNASINTAFTNRIASPNAIQFPYNTVFYIGEGYRVDLVFLDSNGIVTANKRVQSPTGAGTFSVKANQKFKVMIYKISLENVLHIDDYRKQLLYLTQKGMEGNYAYKNAKIRCAGKNILFGNFINGAISSGDITNGTFYYRVTSEIIKYECDIKLEAAEGFEFQIVNYETGVGTSWLTSLEIPANTRFRISIKRQTENTSEIADIDEFVNAIRFKDYINYELDSIENRIEKVEISELFADAEWQRGFVNSSGNYSNVSYIVRTKKCIKFKKDTLVHCQDEDFLFYLFKYSGEEPSSSTYLSWYSGKIYGAFVIPANTWYVLCISKNPEATGTVADIDEYVSKITFYLDAEFSNIKNNNYLAIPAMGNTKQKYVAHMGHWLNFPENTTASFEAAGVDGAWAIETDLRMTSDGYIICMHDSTVNRTTDGTGYVTDMTLEEIRALHIQGDSTGLLKVPTLEEFLGICKFYGCIAQCELKSNEMDCAKKVIQAIKRFGLIKQSFITVTKYNAGYVRKFSIDIPIIFNVEPNTYETILAEAEKYPNANLEFEVNNGELTDEQIIACHNKGYSVGIYVINDETIAKQYFERGVDAVLTNVLPR